MVAFIIRRIVQAALAMFVISMIGFAIMYSFGDPTREMLGVSASIQEREALRERMGLNDPVAVQWLRFIKNAAQGDLGTSYFYRKPALEVVLSKAPATIELVIVSTVIIILISVPAGVYAAVRPRSVLSRLLMGGSIIGVSIPVYLIALVLIFVFSVNLGWLPSFGRGPTTTLFGVWDTNFASWKAFTYIILPSISLSSIMLPLFIRLIKAEMAETLESEYVKFARAKGLSKWRVVMVHGFKNALLPVITVGGVQLGTTIAFTILTETVFQWPGLGFMFIDAVERADTALLVAYLVFCGALFVGVNTVVDILYGIVNPMIRITGRK